MKIKIPSSQLVQEANELVCILQNNLSKILTQSIFQQKILICEKIEYLKTLASAKRALYQAVQSQIPEIVGKSYTVSSVSIEYEDDTTNPQRKDIKDAH